MLRSAIKVLLIGAVLLACGFTIPVGLMGGSGLSWDFTGASLPGGVTANLAAGDSVYPATSATAVAAVVVGANAVREDYGDGNGSGTRTFPSYTNIVGAGASNNIAHGNWSTQNTSTRTADYANGPDGTTTASRFLDTDGGAVANAYQIIGSGAPAWACAWVRDDSGGSPATSEGDLTWADAYHNLGVNLGTGSSWRYKCGYSTTDTYFVVRPSGEVLSYYGATPTSTASATGGVLLWGIQALQYGARLPSIPFDTNSSSSLAVGAATLQLVTPAQALLPGGDLDLTVCGISDWFDSTAHLTNAQDWCVWGAREAGAGDDKLCYTGSSGAAVQTQWNLTVRGAVVRTMVMGLPPIDTEWCVRAWYRPSVNESGLLFMSNGMVEHVSGIVTGTTSGGALATPTAFYLGANPTGSEVAPVRWTRMRTNPIRYSTLRPEIVVLGDSLSEYWGGGVGGNYYRNHSWASSVYTLAQGRARPTGIVNLAFHGERIDEQKTRWDGAPYKGQSQIKCVWIYAGVNDIAQGASAATISTRYQALVDDIAAANPSAKILCQKIGPADAYFDAGQEAVQDATNDNLNGTGSNNITGCHAYVTSIYTALDSSGNLKAACNRNLADGLHYDGICARLEIGPAAATALAAQGCL
jgi:hypothetical protein